MSQTWPRDEGDINSLYGNIGEWPPWQEVTPGLTITFSQYLTSYSSLPPILFITSLIIRWSARLLIKAVRREEGGLFQQCLAVSQLSDQIIDRDLSVSSHNAHVNQSLIAIKHSKLVTSSGDTDRRFMSWRYFDYAPVIVFSGCNDQFSSC